jgi:hypothetical protein
MTHEKEIKRWAECPDGTKVWYRDTKDKEWDLIEYAAWDDASSVYIVDDEYAEVRKFFVDNGYIWRTNWDMVSEKQNNPDFSYPADHYSTSKPDEEVYYYKWKKVIGSKVLVSNYTIDDLYDDWWVRIEESKATFNEIKG